MHELNNHRRNAALALLAAVVLAALLSGGCGGGSAAAPAGAPDVIAPAAAARFTALPGDGAVALSWENPADADFAGVVLARATDTFPLSPQQGETLYAGDARSFLDPCARHGQALYYALFARDAAGNLSTAATASASCAFKPFTFVAIPDTQFYSLDYPAVFNGLTQWIADNARAWNIKIVLHEGDITHNNSNSEWANAVAAMSRLNNAVPYVLSVGNHDITAGSTARFNANFPYLTMKDLPGFGGVYEAGKMDNAYYLFEAGGVEWLVLSLIYNPSDAVLAWAGDMAQQYADRRVILLTHAYLAPDGTRWSVGENIWNKFARLHPNVTFVFNGHYTDGNAARLASTGDAGNKVYQMFANYQTEWFGGKGQIRLVTLDPASESISVKTWSTLGKYYVTDSGNEFVIEDAAFGPLD